MITKQELEEIKKGRPFFTTVGSKCQLLKDDVPGEMPLAVYVEGANEVSTYTDDGFYMRNKSPCIWDLVVERDEKNFKLRFTVTASFKVDHTDAHEINKLKRNIASAIHCTGAMMVFGTNAELVKLRVEEV